jgi:demethylmenaquinone methyltransferase/2-methoxy-6-polyprenyl-1,4-benzoquinol methylase
MSEPGDDGLDYEPGVARVLGSRASTRGYYNKLARVYDLLTERAEQPLRAECLDRLAVAPGERVLEVGPGTGHSLARMAAAVGEGGRVCGVDLAEAMLLRSRATVGEAGVASRVDLVSGDGVALPFADRSFDAAFLSFILELFDTPEIPEVLGEVRRVLRPGGRLGVVAVSREGEHGLALSLYEWAHRHFPTLLDCRSIYVERALVAAGFAITDATIGRMWVPVEIVVGRLPG